MPQTINKLSHLKKINNEEFSENNKIVKNLSSFKETKEFRKRNLKTDVLPSMTVKSNLIKKFREEAQKNDWKLTTLMNRILEERYGKENNNNEDD
ncbi:hypothetical protein [Spiroplasma phoeniceum]|uniref:Uncharacterized protein n=1 Tax=Spiroplasma phoeniceum P40 TaxID=1276259 RepID=A0A345DSU1_9MOLU|nr:hypothetical protein [Spiroplasma phoeniceum]AXF97282.1 hypothetical protein SDAV_003090 [Spiroplasma phoeniceum P40]